MGFIHLRVCGCRLSVITYIVKRYIADIANLSPRSHQMLCKLSSRYIFHKFVLYITVHYGLVSFFFFIGRLQGGALPYWRLEAKRPYLLPSSRPCGPRNSRTEGHHWLSSAR